MTTAATLRGTPAFTATGISGKALTGGVLSVPAVPTLPAAAANSRVSLAGVNFTVEGWINLAANPSGTKVIFGQDAAFWLGVDSSGHLTTIFGIGDNAGNGTQVTLTSTATNFANGSWHHVALVCTNGAPSIYADGALVASSATVCTRSQGSIEGMQIGGFGGNSLSAYDWTGAVDEVAVSNTAVYSGSTYTVPTAPLSIARTGQTHLYHLDADGTDSMEITVTPTSTAIAYSPYTWDVTAARALCVNGGYFATVVSGGAIVANFDVSNVAPAGQQSQIAYRVDGQSWTDLIPTATVVIAIPAATNPSNKHVVEILVKTTSETPDRWDSPYLTGVKFTGFTLPSGATVAKPSTRALNGLIIGDSIVEGINTLGSAGDTTARSDTRLGWAYRVAAELGANVGVVGFGRQGVSVGGNGSVPVLGSTWKNIASGLPRSFTTAPDFVVVHIFANDFLQSVPAATAQAAATALLNDMIATLPTKTKIIWLLPLGSFYPASVSQSAIAACSNPKRVTFVDTTGIYNPSTDSFDNLHPAAFVNLASIAPFIAAAIRTILGKGASSVMRSDGTLKVLTQTRL